MRGRLLGQGCTATWWHINGAGWAANALLALDMWGPLPLWPGLAALTYACWNTGLAWAHDGWVRGWWWQTTDHQCPGDPGDDDPEPGTPPDEPDDEDQPDDNAPTRISSSYTLAA